MNDAQLNKGTTMVSRLFFQCLTIVVCLIAVTCHRDSAAQSRDLLTELGEAKRVFVPADELDVVLERDKRGVMLSRAKFDELLGMARGNAAKAPPANVPLVLMNSDYAARIAGDQLLLTVTAELTQFSSDWQSVSLPMQRLSVEKASLDDEPAMLGRSADGTIVLLSEKSGKHTLKLELSTELNSLGSDQVAAFSLLRAPSGTLTLTLPAGKRLLVGALQLERPAPLEQAADYKVSVGGVAGIQLRITDRAAENSADALTFATTGYGLHVAPGEVTWHALTTLQVFGKPVDRLTFSVPSSLEIADVEATGLESWDLTDGEKPAGADKPATTIITLTFGQAFDGARKISFKGVMSVETGTPWSVPPLTISNITSHIGQVMVQHPAGVRLRVEETTGVRRATQGSKPTADMPDEMSKLNATEFLRFDAWQPDFLLRLTTQPKQREVQTAVAAVMDVNATGLDLQSAIRVETHFAPLFELDLRISADWTIIRATRDDKVLRWQVLPQEAGVNQLRILLDPPLAAGSSGTINLSLRRDVPGWPVESEPITIELPELFLPQSSLNEGALIVRGDDDLDLTALELKGLDTVPLKADYERLRFQSQDTRYSGKLKVTRKPSRLSAQTVVFGRIDPQTTHTFFQAIVEVEGGGVRTLKIALPESAGTALRFQAVGSQIVEQKPAAVQNGERLWTLQFDQRVRGQILLTCDIELPRAAEASFAVPQPRFVDAERQNGYLAVEAGSEQRLTMEAKGADGATLAEVDPLELPAVYYLPKERIVAVYRVTSAGSSLTLSEERFDKLAVPTAVCRKLDLMSVVGRTGELQHRATFQLMAVGVQGIRVILPKDVSLWATLVDGHPVEVRRQGDIYLVPFHRSEHWFEQSASTRNEGLRELKLFYRSATSALTQFGSIEQSPPELSVQTGQGISQPVDVLDQSWTVHYPPETRLVSSNGPLEPQQKLDETSLLGQFNAGFRAPTLVELGWQVFAVVVTLGAIALAVLVYRRLRTIRFGWGSVLLLGVVGAGTLSLLILTAKPERRSMPYMEYESAKHAPVRAVVTAPAMPAPSKSEISEAAPAAGDLPAPTAEQPMAEFKKELASVATKRKSESGGERDERKQSVQEQTLADMVRPDPAAADGKPADPFVAQAPPQAPPVDQAPRQDRDLDGVADAEQRNIAQPASGKNSNLGLLSLAIDLNAPNGSLEKSFRYAGADPARGGIGLQLGYVDEHSGTNLRVFLMALVAMIGWFLRKSSCATKTALVALALTIPLALLPLVPQGVQIVLDGVFFGAVIASAIWLAIGITNWCESCCLGCCGWMSVAGRQKAGVGEVKNEPTHGSPTATGLMLLAVITLNNVALAQKTAPQSAPKDAAASPPAQKAPAAPAIPKPAASTNIVVPFDVGDDPLDSDKILLPFDKFAELYRLAYPDRPLGKTTAPQAGVVIEALYSAKIVANEKTPDESALEVTARYAVRSYVDGQLQVELPLGKVAARDAKLNGKTAALITNGDCLKVAVSAPGLHVLDFSFSIPARLSGTTGTFTLPLLAVPSGKLAFALPAKDLSVRINGSTTIFRRVTNGETQTIELPIDKGGDLAVTWQPEQAKGAAAAVVHVDSVQAVTLTDAGAAVSNGYQYRVRQGSIADVSFDLPTSLKLQSVNGPDVGGWELQGEGASRKLRVIFRRNVTDTTKLTVEAFLDAKVGREATVIEVPAVAPHEVTNEIGQITIFAGDQFSLRSEKAEGLSQTDGDKFTTQVPVSRPNAVPQLAYRFSKRPFTLSLRAVRQESQANVTAQQAAFVTRRKQMLTSRLLYNLTGAPRSSLNLLLPANFVILDVKATGLHDWSVATQGDVTTLTIDLNAPRLGLTEVVLSGSIARDGDTDLASISFPRPLDATKLSTTAAIWLDDGYTATLDRFDGWRSIDSALVSNDLKSVRANKPVQFAFSANALAPSDITLNLTLATPKLSANGLTMTTVTDVAVIHTLALQWQIDSATSDSLIFTTPSSLAGKLVFTGNGIRETTHAEAGNGRTRWTIWLRTPISGRYFATAVGTLPPATTEVEAPSVVMEGSQGDAGPKPIDGQRQYVLLINASQNQLTTVDPSVVESVQREDVPVVVDQDLVDQATELVRVKKLLTAPKWSLQKFAQTAGAPASVNVADLTTVISRDGTYRGQAIYTIKNRSRQFLAIKLPVQTELLSVYVGDQPSRAVTTKRKDESIQLIALPKTSSVGMSFPVKIVWRGKMSKPLPKSATIFRSEIDVPSPVVVSQADDAEFGIPVARTRWTVYLPDDLDARPLKSTSRHNLTWQDAGEYDFLYEKAALQEISERIGMLSQSGLTSQQRYVGVKNNLKQLGLALHNYHDSQIQDAEYLRQRSQVRKQLEDFERTIQIDEGRQSVSFVAPQTGQDNAGKSSSGEGNSVQGLDSQMALERNRDNNYRLFLSNGGDGVQLGGDREVATFNFALQNQEAEERSKEAKESKPQAGKAQVKGDNLEQRRQFLAENDTNLGTLNTIIENNRASGQQGQQGLQVYGNQAVGLRRGLPNQPQSGFRGGQQGGGQQGQQDLTGMWMANSTNPAAQNGSFGNSFSGVQLFDNSGWQTGSGNVPINPNNSFGVGTNFDDKVRFNAPPSGMMQRPGPMVDGPGSGPLPALSQNQLQQRNDAQQFNAAKDFFANDPLGVHVNGEMAQAEGLMGGGGGGMMANGDGGVSRGWTQAGGLSLQFDLPSYGRKLVFSKAGGDPKLALGLRSQETVRQGLGLVWAAVWLAVGLGIAVAVRGSNATSRLTNRVPMLVAVLGVLGFILLPRPLSVLSFIAFVAASVVVAWIHRKGPVSAS